MANRYMSNLRSNASPGYYDTISAIVAADSQARSAAIQGRYDAMSNSITVIADSMIKGMNSAAQYQLEQEKLITARRIAESEMAAKATEMQIREQEAESNRLMNQARLDQATRENQRVARQQAIAPLAREYVQSAAAVAAEMAQADSYQKREAIRKKFSEDFRVKSMDLEAGKSELMPGVAVPGAYGAFSSNEGVIAVDVELSKQVASVGSVRLRDPKTGLDMSQRRIAETLSNPDSPLLAQEMAYRATLDPEAPVEVRQQGATFMKERLASADSMVRMRATLLDWETRGSPEIRVYNAERERGVDEYKAFETARTKGASGIKRLDTLFGTRSPGSEDAGSSAIAGAQATLKKSVADKWDVAYSKIRSLQESNEFGTIGLLEEGEKQNVAVVHAGVRRALEGLAREIANTDNVEAKNEAKRKYDLIAADPTSDEAKRILIGSEGGLFARGGSGTIAYGEARSPYGLGVGFGGSKSPQAAGDDRAALLRRRSVTEMLERGGAAWIPPNTSSAPQSLVSTVGNFGPLSREAAAYRLDPEKAINPETGEPFRSVEEAVLYEREKRFGSVKEVLARLYSDGYLEGSGIPAGVREPPRGSSFLSTAGAVQPRSGVMPSMVGDGKVPSPQ